MALADPARAKEAVTLHPDFPQRSETYIRGLTFNAIRMHLRHEASTRDLKVHTDSDAGITVQLARGLLSFSRAGAGVQARVQAPRPEWLQVLKEGLVERLGQVAPDSVDGLRWSGSDQAGKHPANFHFARVLSVTPLGRAFVRVRASVKDLSGFQDDAIHFRLVLPPEGATAVQWPTLAANGTAVWPKGDQTLHRPVYTVRMLDHATGTLDFDVFLHEGGRVTNWVHTVLPGATFGISGPVGGGIPQTARLLAYADETAFPALARILENLPCDSVGQVTLFADAGAECAYPIHFPDGISVKWHIRADGTDLADLALADHSKRPDHFLWVASEKSEVQRVRAAFKDNNGDPAQAYISAYWSRP
ncbi:siderophore-interacting protein [Rhodobacteraceae bacterium B1Z28]|uniref:Siderophore-interacting protein n=1 Tax=Ruegeria haliotis TaxID=2747601 RepID=A0ABX2PVZ9_9RHOB|nr:siderophore-interacting protein [Ruegeria haliotis]NVO58316.1 siderophore-interacting protein [Ruegeria haliotis]